MARNRRRHPHHRPHPTTRHLHVVDEPQPPSEQDWRQALEPLRAALRAPSPAEFLLQVSALLALIEEGGLESPQAGTVSLPMMVDALVTTPYAEATAALTAIRHLADDPALHALIDAELPRRRHPLPTWLRHLDEATAPSPVAHASDGTPAAGNLAFSLRFADTSEISVITFLDPMGGGTIRDAYLSEDGFDTVVEVLDGLTDLDTSLHVDDPAASRALLEHALRQSAHVEPLEDSETWPGLRPLVRWAIGLLPEGGAYDPDDDDGVYDDVELDDEWGEIARYVLLSALGSDEAIIALDDTPLPDEPFDWAGVPDDLRGTIAEVLNWCDRAAGELFDVEHRTAFRRFLARVAVAEPAILRRKASVERTAAAVVWAVGRANQTVSSPGGITAKALMAWFGVTGTPSSRAVAMADAVGARPGDPDGSLGSADLLTSARRARLLRLRDELWNPEDFDEMTDPPRAERGSAFGLPPGGLHITHRPGMAAEMLETLKPFLAEEGVDLDGDVPDLETLNEAMARASAAYNLSLATPRGRARESVIATLRQIVGLVVHDDAAAAFAMLDTQVVPESRDGSRATVAGTMGVALTLLDTLLTGRDPVAPEGVGRAVSLPAPNRAARGGRAAAEILDLAVRGRAFTQQDALFLRGSQMLDGVVIALAAAARGWAEKSGLPVGDVVAELIR